MNKLTEPIKFVPILKEKIWGGSKLKTLLDKSIPSNKTGESWEISDVDEDVSIVAEGSLKGQSLSDLIATYKGDLVGSAVYKMFGNKFPLLIKYIDAEAPLSIQLHPNDELAQKRHNSFGKTEMWYVMQADPGGNLIVGFNRKLDKEEYLEHLSNKTLTKILNIDPVKEGDVYFIHTGLVHAIGAGVVLAEIQQTSDITYRLYDWDRVDDEGNSRELHTALALDAIDFTWKPDYQTHYSKDLNKINKVIQCEYFTTNFIPVTEKFIFQKDNTNSFTILMALKGSMKIRTATGVTEFKKGETLLLPAVVTRFELLPSEESEILEIHIDL